MVGSKTCHNTNDSSKFEKMYDWVKKKWQRGSPSIQCNMQIVKLLWKIALNKKKINIAVFMFTFIFTLGIWLLLHYYGMLSV